MILFRGVDSDDHQTLIFEFFFDPMDPWEAADAAASRGSPDLDQDNLAFDIRFFQGL
ncbi:MAG: hypothetical protein OEZ59_13140 [Deltaproteobacteria bacterium]|nr:hypothetical protein [Deltaproteobacteria bacterium]